MTSDHLPKASSKNAANKTLANAPFAIAIHGGAGTISTMSTEKETVYKATLEQALQAGYHLLTQGASSLDAVQAAVQVLEDSPLFNAGKGAVYTHDETHELDAAIMDGRNCDAGAVIGINTVKNPIQLARAVMEQSTHTILAGSGAEAFANTIDIETIDHHYFHTDARLAQVRKIKANNPDGFQLSEDDDYFSDEGAVIDDKKFGTVGAVALDKAGNLAAATSTGGLSNKKFGRVGVSPIIGAGTYANNKTCAISATGHGEFFIRSVVAHDISALQEYGNLSLAQAADKVIHQKLTHMGGDGGIVGIDKHGNITLCFNAKDMFRGSIDKDGKIFVGIYG